MFSFNKVEKSTDASMGWTWGGTAGNNSIQYTSMNEIESDFEIKIPFPEEFNSQVKEGTSEITVNVEDDEFVSYYYYLGTDHRSYTVSATNVSKERPSFMAETSKETVINKEVLINGSTSNLLGVKDLNGYYMYMEKGDWRIAISAFGDANGESEPSEVTEEEMITIAESIEW